MTAVTRELPPWAENCARLALEKAPGVTLRELLSRKRARAFSRPRQTAFWLAFRALNKSRAQIGRAFERDHTTIIHGIAVVDHLRGTDPLLAAQTDAMAVTLASLSDHGAPPTAETSLLFLGGGRG